MAEIPMQGPTPADGFVLRMLDEMDTRLRLALEPLIARLAGVEKKIEEQGEKIEKQGSNLTACQSASLNRRQDLEVKGAYREGFDAGKAQKTREFTGWAKIIWDARKDIVAVVAFVVMIVLYAVKP